MKSNLFRLTSKQLILSNVYLGNGSIFFNTKIKPYLLGSRGNNYLFNTSFTFFQLKQIIKIIINLVAHRQKILIVKDINFYKFENYLLLDNVFYFDKKWIGGLLTNFRMVRKSRKLWQNKLLSNSLPFLRYMPSLLFIFNTNRSKWALLEGHSLEIPITAVLGNDSQYFDIINYPIIGNNKTFESTYLYISVLRNAIIAGKRKERLKILRIL